MPTPIGHLLFQLEGLVEQNQDPQQQQQPTERGLPAEPPPSTTAFYGRFYRRCDAGTQRTRPGHARGVTVSYLYMTDSVPTAAR